MAYVQLAFGESAASIRVWLVIKCGFYTRLYGMCMSSLNGVEQVRFNGLYQSLRAMTFIEGSLACFAINLVDTFTVPLFFINALTKCR